jgi:DNA-binding Xre family transcriptional regulator
MSATPISKLVDLDWPLASALIVGCETPMRSAMRDCFQPRAVSSEITCVQSTARTIGPPIGRRNRRAYGCFPWGFQNPWMDTIGERVRALWTARHVADRAFTQTALAHAIDIAQPSLSQIMSGKTQEIAGKTLAGLCRELRTTPEFIMFGAGNSVANQEAVLIEAEVVHILRTVTPEKREAILGAVRGIAQTSAPSVANPFQSKRKVK